MAPFICYRTRPMSKQSDYFQHYTVADFAMNDDFVRWVLQPDKASDIFWQKVAQQSPEQAANIDAAAGLVRHLHTQKQVAGQETKDRIWANVLREGSRGKVVKVRRPRMAWWAAAALLIVAGTLITYLQVQQPAGSGPGVATQSGQITADIPPGGNKAMLVLSDGSRVNLADHHTGRLTEEGGAVVKKTSDGQLAYEHAGAQPAVPAFNTIITPKGGQYQLTLTDGTKVWLNAASSLRFPAAFASDLREVEVTGEAYFEVASEPARPFLVKSGGMEVQVLGTHFNVNAYADNSGFKTTLLEGAVAVRAHQHTVTLKPGEQVDYRDNALGPVIKGVNTSQVISWKNETFDFTDEQLANIAKELARWYNVEIEIEKNILNKRFSGIVSRKNNLSKVLEVLEFSGGIRTRVAGNKVIFSN